jgi:glycosyltransferase involved in cell wall biosynthesis
MEAMLVSNPVISTNCGGIHEYLQNDEHAKLIPYKSIPLKGNNRNQQWYLPDQNWAEIDAPQLMKALREVYNNQQQARNMGARAKAFVSDKFSLEAVGKYMRKRLEEIST